MTDTNQAERNLVRHTIALKGPITCKEIASELHLDARIVAKCLRHLSEHNVIDNVGWNSPSQWTIRPGEITKTADLRDALVGRTIVDARMDDEDQKYEDWNYQGGDLTLILDDGSILQTSSGGYDAWSNSISIAPPPPTG